MKRMTLQHKEKPTRKKGTQLLKSNQPLRSGNGNGLPGRMKRTSLTELESVPHPNPAWEGRMGWRMVNPWTPYSGTIELDWSLTTDPLIELFDRWLVIFTVNSSLSFFSWTLSCYLNSELLLGNYWSFQSLSSLWTFFLVLIEPLNSFALFIVNSLILFIGNYWALLLNFSLTREHDLELLSSKVRNKGQIKSSRWQEFTMNKFKG